MAVTVQLSVILFAQSDWLRSARKNQLLSQPFRNMLLDVIMWSLRCFPYVLTITVAVVLTIELF